MPGFRQRFEELFGHNEAILLSEELFTGNPFYGYSNRTTVIARLAAIFPEAKIILSLRGQKQLLNSLYSEYVFQGGTKTAEEFCRYERKGKSILSSEPIFNLETLSYCGLVDRLDTLFGMESVFIMPFEALVEEPVFYFEHLGSFLGENLQYMTKGQRKLNLSKNLRSITMMRNLNALYRSPMYPTGFLAFQGIQ